MTVYADYTPDEQQILRRGMRSAAVAVSASSPGRKEETVSEGFAAAELILGSRSEYVSNTLVTSIIVEIEQRLAHEQPFPDYLEVATATGAREAAIEDLHAVVSLLEARSSPDEAAGYKRWLMSIATVTAQAGKEDQGFLGMGGVAVNAAERAVLEEIAGILGIEG